MVSGEWMNIRDTLERRVFEIGSKIESDFRSHVDRCSRVVCASIYLNMSRENRKNTGEGRGRGRGEGEGEERERKKSSIRF